MSDFNLNAVTVRTLSKDATEKDITTAATVLRDAFKEDKFNKFLTGNHDELLYDMELAIVKAGLIGGLVQVAEADGHGVIGATVWYGPGQELLSAPGEAEAGFSQFMADLGAKDPDMPGWWMGDFLPKYKTFTTECLNGPEFKHDGWHLQLIGVSPAHQRRGVGTTLIQTIEDKVSKDPKSTPASKQFSLETETEGAYEFYRKVGFVDRGKIIVHSEAKMHDTVPMWCFAKEL